MKEGPGAAGSHDIWASGQAYEQYVGRWSRAVSSEFLAWLKIPGGSRWLDVGCGTGALTHMLLQLTEPAYVLGVDSSPAFIEFARGAVRDDRVLFRVADAEALPAEDGTYDVVVSALAANFFPRPDRAVTQMVRATRRGGTVAAYVWDYAGNMQFLRRFWDAAAALDPVARDLDEGRRFPLCQPDPLRELFRRAGLAGVDVRAIDAPTDFKTFDDFWSPFLEGQGPAPGYVMSLSEEERSRLRDRLRATLPLAADGSIRLVARAWAVRGEV